MQGQGSAQRVDIDLTQQIPDNTDQMEVKIQKILAQNVKSRRERMGLSQTELGKRVGLSLSGIQKIERGDRWPSPENVENIAEALGIPATALFSGMPSKVTPQEALAVLADHLWRLENE